MLYNNLVKIIPLSQNKETIVSVEDYEYLSQWKWSYHKDLKVAYRVTNLVDCECGKRHQVTIYMHREVVRARPTEEVDHINHNTLDNTRENLRLCDSYGNARNRRKPKRQKESTSIYKGVWKQGNKWRARIVYNKKVHYIGTFNTEHEAGIAYNNKAIELFGEFACLNNIQTVEDK